MPASDLLSRLSAVRPSGKHKWMARCPAHQDVSPSLSIAETDDGKVLVHCFAGCPVDDVLAAVGLEMDALFPPRESSGKPLRSYQRMPGHVALRAVANEATLVLVTARALMAGEVLDEAMAARLAVAVGRIEDACRIAEA